MREIWKERKDGRMDIEGLRNDAVKKREKGEEIGGRKISKGRRIRIKDRRNGNLGGRIQEERKRSGME